MLSTFSRAAQQADGGQFRHDQEPEPEGRPHLPEIEEPAVAAEVAPESDRVGQQRRDQATEAAEGDAVGVDGHECREGC